MDSKIERISFYSMGYVENSRLKYAIIVAKHKDRWIFVRQKGKLTWELPAGHREKNENIFDTARRELREETGAVEFEIRPICIYSVRDKDTETFGQLFYAEISELGELPESEIDRIAFFDTRPGNLTYPSVQPALFDKARGIDEENRSIVTFLGINLKDDLKADIGEYQRRIKKCSEKGRWKRPDNFHITIKYLGETELSKLDDIDRVMKNLNLSPPVIYISELNCFRRKGKLRVLYLGISGATPELNSLYEKVEDNMVSIGFSKENRDYTPHLTLGHDVVFDREFDELAEAVGKIQFMPIEVKAITLFESKVVDGRRAYIPIKEYAVAESIY